MAIQWENLRRVYFASVIVLHAQSYVHHLLHHSSTIHPHHPTTLHLLNIPTTPRHRRHLHHHLHPRRRRHHHLHHHQPIIHHRSRHKHRHGILYGALLHLLVIISTLLRAKHPLERDRTPILTTTSTPQRPLLFLSMLPISFYWGSSMLSTCCSS